VKSLFYIGFCRQNSHARAYTVVGSTPEAKIAGDSTTMADNREVVQRRTFAKGFTRNFSVFLDDVVAEPRSDLRPVRSGSILMNLGWLLYGYHAILFWVALPIAIFLLFWWLDRRKRK